MSYMAKKTQKRQTTIISLSDSNQQELENIRQQREQILKEYQDKKQGIVFKIHKIYFTYFEKILIVTVLINDFLSYLISFETGYA